MQTFFRLPPISVCFPRLFSTYDLKSNSVSPDQHTSQELFHLCVDHVSLCRPRMAEPSNIGTVGGLTTMKKITACLFTFFVTALVTAYSTSAQDRRSHVISERIPIETVGFDQCGGSESYSGSGVFHGLVRTYTDNDGTIRLDAKANGHFSFMGERSGIRWVMNETFRQFGTESEMVCPAHYDVIDRRRIISQGPLQNAFTVLRSSFDYDEACNLTFSQPSITVDCRGR